MNKSERIIHNAKIVEKFIAKKAEQFSNSELKYIADRLAAIIREAGDNGQTKAD